MSGWQHRTPARLLYGAVATCAVLAASAFNVQAQTFPQYDHVFLVVMESEPYQAIIGYSYAPILNALAQDYGLAMDYRGVGDPSEPNYVGMLGGDTFRITTDDPYWFPGHTIDASNLMSQLESVGKTWRGYFQSMPYPGYRGYCYPDKCNGIPDSDTQYVSKHNGMINFADIQTPSELAKMYPLTQLMTDLSTGDVPNFGYIVGNECNDMHGAPPWCVDTGIPGSVQQNWLIAQGDRFAGGIVNEITSSSVWKTGNNAVVITFDEGSTPDGRVPTIVVTNHGPRGLTDKTSYNHYSLLASLQKTFGVGCLLNSCSASLMSPLFAITGATSIPALPPPYSFPTGNDTVSPQGAGEQAAPVSLSGSGWIVEPSYNFTALDNNLTGASAASATDAWAVGAYYPPFSNVLATLAHHFDGTRWTAYPLPNVGVQQNVLLGVSMPAPGLAWAVGYYESGRFEQQTLIEHFDGSVWSVVPSPNPGALQNILYGVAASTDSDVWAVGAQQDAAGLWHTLTEHWDGAAWSVVNAVDAGSSGNQFYAVKAVDTDNVYAVGQQAGSGFPNEALIEHWNGTAWGVVPSPADLDASAVPLGVTARTSSLTFVGQQETDKAPYTTYVAAGAAGSLTVQDTPNVAGGENDLFGTTTAADGSTWAVGWDLNIPAAVHDPLILEGVNGTWSLVPSPSLGKGSDSGLEGITTIPGGGMWAVGVTASATGSGNYATLIEYHQ